jgi:molybdopterin molybdotransferase
MKPDLPSYSEAAATVRHFATRLRQTPPPAETVELATCAGRVLAEQLLADTDQPPFPRSTRDGFACRAAEASQHKPLRIAGSIHAGQPPSGPLPPGSAWEIMTGAPVPPGADAVAMVEHVEVTSEQVRLSSPRTLKPGENIVTQGAQARAGSVLLEPGTLIGAGQIALAASCGHSHLQVFTRPRVAILTTGDELVPVRSQLEPGQIRNSNAPMLAALATQAGAIPTILPTAADTPEALDAAFAQALDADLLVISGGVSAGKFDLVEPALARLQAHFHFTGVRIQPGKPLVFGEIPRPGHPSGSLPFFGLPGNPVSSAATFVLFASTVLAALGGREGGPRFTLARLDKAPGNGGVKPGLTRFLPASCNFSASSERVPEVALVPAHGSGDLAALALSNCFVVIPEDSRRLEPGAIVRILLF